MEPEQLGLGIGGETELGRVTTWRDREGRLQVRVARRCERCGAIWQARPSSPFVVCEDCRK